MAKKSRRNSTRATENDIVIVNRKPQKGEIIRAGKRVSIQNNGNVGSQTIISLSSFNGDLYL